MQIKLLFFADLHIDHYQEFNDQLDSHGSSRLTRCLDALKFIFKTAYEKQVNAIIDCGDLINKKNNIDFRVYGPIFDAFKLDKPKEINFFSLVGNHNISSVHEMTNLDLLKDYLVPINNIFSLDFFNELVISFIPYRRDIKEWRKDLTHLKKDISKTSYPTPPKRILVGHQEIKGAITNTHTATEGLEPNELPQGGLFDYCIFGHYHKFQKINDNSFYCGAALQQNFGEVSNPQGFWIYTYDTEIGKDDWEWISIDSPEFLITEYYLDIAEDTKHFWKLVTDLDVVLKEEHQHHVRPEIKPKEEEVNRLNLKQELDLKEMIQKYLDAKVEKEKHQAVWKVLSEVEKES